MEYVFYALIGVVSGILGGMGMGGGTLFIPLSVVLLGVAQKTAQAVNLASFLPMAGAAVILHAKNKLIVYKDVLFIVLPSLLFGVLGCFLARSLDADILKKAFGGFLVLLAFLQGYNAIKK